MEDFISKLNPRRVFEFFSEISRIPRASGNESKIAAYLCDFAKRHHMDHYRDAQNNVLIQYTPTAVAAAPCLLLQGHSDMVAVAEPAANHDFEIEPLALFLDAEGMLGAKHTSLGADNGIGVAMMLALLEEKPRRPLDCLFTSCEEVGMEGALSFDYSKIRARQMINLDSEDEHEVVVGCAGGMRIHATAKASSLSCSGRALRVRLDGFFGGHSGTDIARGRTNAARLLCKILLSILEKYDGRLISVCGGEKDNAIPSCAAADILVSPAASEEIRTLFKRQKHLFCAEDRNSEISVESFDFCGDALDAFSSKKLLRCILRIKNGVVDFDERLHAVMTSLNLGVLKIDSSVAMLEISLRSCEDATLQKLAKEVEATLAAGGFTFGRSGAYPAWPYRANSKLLSDYIEVYRRHYGDAPSVYSIHAGLECGVICSSLREMEAISIGPTVLSVHTTHERLDTASVDRVYRLLKEIVDA